MGADAMIYIRAKKEFKPKFIKELQYQLMHRVDKDFFWINGNDNFIAKSEYEYAQERVLYEVKTLNRYYGEGYERGPAMKIATVLLYLINKLPNEDILYTSDYEGYHEGLNVFTKSDCHKLIDLFISEGRFPYVGGARSLIKGGVEIDTNCSYCETPMNQYGFRGDYAAYSCMGCGEKIIYDKGKIKREKAIE